MSFNAIELCAGGGGQALGLEMAGYHHVAAVEYEPHYCTTLRTNRPQWKVVEDDIRNFRSQDYSEIDLLAGGVPCPPFSIAGKQLGADDERDMFPAALQIVETIRPRAVLFENVQGLASAKFQEDRLLNSQARNNFVYRSFYSRCCERLTFSVNLFQFFVKRCLRFAAQSNRIGVLAAKRRNTITSFLQILLSLRFVRPNNLPVTASFTASVTAYGIVREKRFPTSFCQLEIWKLIISPLFIVTFFTSKKNIARNVQSSPKTIHSVRMFHCNSVILKRLSAVTTTHTECSNNGISVARVANAKPKSGRDFPANFVKKHADELVCYVRFGARRCLAKVCRSLKTHRVDLVLRSELPSNQLASTFKTEASAFSSKSKAHRSPVSILANATRSIWIPSFARRPESWSWVSGGLNCCRASLTRWPMMLRDSAFLRRAAICYLVTERSCWRVP